MAVVESVFDFCSDRVHRLLVIVNWVFLILGVEALYNPLSDQRGRSISEDRFGAEVRQFDSLLGDQ